MKTPEQIAEGSTLYFHLGSDNYPELITCMEEYAEQFKIGWVPFVKEFPKIGENVLIYNPKLNHTEVYKVISSKSIGGGYVYWMTIPKPPQP